MCGLKTRTLLFLFILAFSSLAQAKRVNLVTASPFGLTFASGIEPRPRNDFVDSPQSSSAGFGYFFAFGPFLDLINFSLRPTIIVHYHPMVKNTGNLSSGTYADSSDGSTIGYGAHMLFSPLQFSGFQSRIYFAASIFQNTTTLKNVRNTTSSSGSAGSNYTERVSGKSTRTAIGLGYEFFALQNYMFGVESGYEFYGVQEFKYAGTSDIYGNTVNKNTTVVSPYGANKKFRLKGLYAETHFSIRF